MKSFQQSKHFFSCLLYYSVDYKVIYLNYKKKIWTNKF